MRSLAADEKELWARVASTIRPLSRDPIETPPSPVAPELRKQQRQPSRPAPARVSAPAAPAGTLDSSWDRRLSSGEADPDVTIDLHGFNLDQAWSAIDVGLDRAIASGKRVVLLITGHARRGEPPVKRGKIRAVVHDWLEASRHSQRIAAVRGAHRRHGGGGSLYIILRRDRSKSTIP
ncbi:Smr/MutS family protein [soil metagenome]